MHIKTYALGGDAGIHMPSYVVHVYSNAILWQYIACTDGVTKAEGS